MGNDTTEKESKDKSEKEDMEAKVKAMEKKIEELEKSLGEKKEPERHEESFVGDLVGSLIPGFGKIVKTLEKTSPEFRQRIAETDSEIKHRLETGWGEKEPSIDYGLSVRPLGARSAKSTRVSTREKPKKKVKEVKIESAEIEPVFDVFEEEKYISVIAEIPGAEEADIQIGLEGNKLSISAGKYSKVIVLPSEAEAIEEKTFKNGVLQLKIKRRENANKD